MGKASGVISSAVFVGLFAILIYFCCRVKRRGAVIQQNRANANNFDNTAGAANQRPQHIPGGLVGYPQQSYLPPGQSHGIYGPTTIPTGQPYPYPMNNASVPQSNLPYPTNPGMPMPGVIQNPMQQSATPYPMAPSAPANEDYDKPPSYEEVIRQQH